MSTPSTIGQILGRFSIESQIPPYKGEAYIAAPKETKLNQEDQNFNNYLKVETEKYLKENSEEDEEDNLWE